MQQRMPSGFGLILMIGALVGALPMSGRSAQSAGPGRILSSTGGLWGGLSVMNPDASNAINLTSNTFDQSAPTPDGRDPRSKSMHPSVSADGRIAFMSDRDGTGYRLFLLNKDGSGLRQLTRSPGPARDGTIPWDLYPVISPDGTRVAFISNRSDVDIRPGEPMTFRDIYVINTDGSGLHAVTTPQVNQGSGIFGSVLYSIAWRPDGRKLAFRGVRLATVNGVRGFHQLLGTINPDGSGETALAILDSPGGSEALDWSPDGRYLAVVFGGEAQSAPERRLIIWDLQSGSVAQYLESQIGSLPIGVGCVRFSPDSTRLVFPGDGLTFINRNGTGRKAVAAPVPPYEPLWWQAGPAVPKPTRLTLSPDPLVTYLGAPLQQVTPTLSDAAGNVIYHSATGWTIDPYFGGSPLVTPTGQVTGGTVDAVYRLTANDYGLTASTNVLVATTPIVSIRASGPAASEAGSKPGVFTLSRIGNPEGDVTVHFAVTGSAAQGTDYRSLPASVRIPARQFSVSVSVIPLADRLLENSETATVTIQPGPGYAVGDSSTATLSIADDPSTTAPGTLTAGSVSAGRVHLSWRDLCSNETAVEIQRRSGSGSFQAVGSATANATSFDDAGLSATTAYAYRVRAVNGSLTSAFSSEARVTTLAPGRLVVSPKSLKFSTVKVRRQKTKKVRLRNSGQYPVSVIILAPLAPFAVKPSGAITVQAGKSLVLSVVFRPTRRGRATGSLTISSDDPRARLVKVSLRGKGT